MKKIIIFKYGSCIFRFDILVCLRARQISVISRCMGFILALPSLKLHSSHTHVGAHLTHPHHDTVQALSMVNGLYQHFGNPVL